MLHACTSSWTLTSAPFATSTWTTLMYPSQLARARAVLPSCKRNRDHSCPVISTRCKLVNIQNGSYLQLTQNVQCVMYTLFITAWLKQNIHVQFRMTFSSVGYICCGVGARSQSHTKMLVYTYMSFQVHLGPTVSQE